jgi:hypothetical protein
LQQSDPLIAQAKEEISQLQATLTEKKRRLSVVVSNKELLESELKLVSLPLWHGLPCVHNKFLRSGNTYRTCCTHLTFAMAQRPGSCNRGGTSLGWSIRIPRLARTRRRTKWVRGGHEASWHRHQRRTSCGWKSQCGAGTLQNGIQRG